MGGRSAPNGGAESMADWMSVSEAGSISSSASAALATGAHVIGAHDGAAIKLQSRARARSSIEEVRSLAPSLART